MVRSKASVVPHGYLARILAVSAGRPRDSVVRARALGRFNGLKSAPQTCRPMQPRIRPPALAMLYAARSSFPWGRPGVPFHGLEVFDYRDAC